MDTTVNMQRAKDDIQEILGAVAEFRRFQLKQYSESWVLRAEHQRADVPIHPIWAELEVQFVPSRDRARGDYALRIGVNTSSNVVGVEGIGRLADFVKDLYEAASQVHAYGEKTKICLLSRVRDDAAFRTWAAVGKLVRVRGNDRLFEVVGPHRATGAVMIKALKPKKGDAAEAHYTEALEAVPCLPMTEKQRRKATETWAAEGKLVRVRGEPTVYKVYNHYKDIPGGVSLVVENGSSTDQHGWNVDALVPA